MLSPDPGPGSNRLEFLICLFDIPSVTSGRSSFDSRRHFACEARLFSIPVRPLSPTTAPPAAVVPARPAQGMAARRPFAVLSGQLVLRPGVEVAGVMAFVQLARRLAAGPVDLAAARYRRPCEDLVGPAQDVLVFVHGQEFVGTVLPAFDQAAVPGPDCHVGDRERRAGASPPWHSD